MTKAMVGAAVLLGLALIGVLYWSMNNQELAILNRQLDEQRVTIADLGNKLNTCLAEVIEARSR